MKRDFRVFVDDIIDSIEKCKTPQKASSLTRSLKATIQKC
jgi:hypothetical protein